MVNEQPFGENLQGGYFQKCHYTIGNRIRNTAHFLVSAVLFGYPATEYHCPKSYCLSNLMHFDVLVCHIDLLLEAQNNMIFKPLTHF
jgi:hypothetical protein